MLSVLSILESVEAVLLPRACLACERSLRSDAATPLCDQCRLSLRTVTTPKCRRCGQTLDRWEMKRSVESCGFCREWPASLEWAASAVWFEDGAARELVHALKYGGWTVAAKPMAAVMARELKTELERADALVPIPLGAARLRERGHNQAAVLAEALGARCGIEVAHDLLVRARETRTQTSLHPAERRANVQGAFRATRPFNGRALLVDDVLTTGATLAAAAEALGGAGAVTFARAMKPE